MGGRFNGGGRHGRGHGRNKGGSGGYVYAYPYYVPYPVGPDDGYDQDQPDSQADQQEAPAPTIFENRREYRPAPNPTPTGSGSDDSRYGEHYLDGREQRATTADAGSAPDTRPEPTPPTRQLLPVILVFKDGHQQEIANYAIVGDTLYDIGSLTARKIKLADLDLQQTIQRNEERGVEFNLPVSQKVKA
jgi:hypothetical protein